MAFTQGITLLASHPIDSAGSIDRLFERLQILLRNGLRRTEKSKNTSA